MSDITTVAVAGAGVLGSQIIMQNAYAGMKVHAFDTEQAVLEKLPARWEWMRKYYRKDLPEFTEEAFDAAIARITPTSDYAEAFANCDLVIEAVPEDIEIKRAVWKTIGQHVREDAVLLTNTSSLLPSEFADASGHPEHFLALHHANLIWIQNIGEVMGHSGTDPAYVERTVKYCESVNLVPVVVQRESSRFILNKMIKPFLDAGVEMFMTGLATVEDIDKAWTVSTQAPKGPMATMDVIGFRPLALINKHSENPLVRDFAGLLEERITEGKAGLADGEGFYLWNEDGEIIGRSDFGVIAPALRH
ncbi:3-hydroxyacyl-CoA dehydrogenase [Enteractinococcus fodinae]|uniref:3-hydroxybutyryl-CoA dehydrogenase n=1 Tax=Enteractinococcus fodinae TaxID=684663 RepID=A0ABU2B498_9MICC|nr:3-hydroxyacyl-CoA dehydrogenase NAD-binding domain-containing protein [Enteractinococcus fodinae]MDR7348430.1 3-hydroxybutyryl-CoA dehydrogenase [Enteractinococcus fodinae]